MKTMTMSELKERGLKPGDIYYEENMAMPEHTGWRLKMKDCHIGLNCECEGSWGRTDFQAQVEIKRIILADCGIGLGYGYKVANFMKTFDDSLVQDSVVEIVEDVKVMDVFAKIDEIVKKLDSKSLIERALKLSEECGEVAEAVLSYEKVSGCGYKQKESDDVIEECVDVILIALSIISQARDGIDKDELLEELEAKINKWEEKTKEDK